MARPCFVKTMNSDDHKWGGVSCVSTSLKSKDEDGLCGAHDCIGGPCDCPKETPGFQAPLCLIVNCQEEARCFTKDPRLRHQTNLSFNYL